MEFLIIAVVSAPVWMAILYEVFDMVEEYLEEQ